MGKMWGLKMGFMPVVDQIGFQVKSVFNLG